jgi:hypothetical protein
MSRMIGNGLNIRSDLLEHDRGILATDDRKKGVIFRTDIADLEAEPIYIKGDGGL